VSIIVIVLSLAAVARTTGSASGLTGGIAVAIVLFIYFLIRNIYFIFFEIAWRGATPGKRVIGLRVIDRHGGPLLPTAVIARNLTREVEMFLPLGILLSWGRPAEGVTDWEQFFLAIWMLFFGLLPAINRDRMRGGDLIAGTMVIALPKRALFERSGGRSRAILLHRATICGPMGVRIAGARGIAAAAGLCGISTGAQRRLRQDLPQDRLDRAGAAQQGRAVSARFYTAERAFLEREQLYGKGRADKFAQPGPIA